jgi:hypothetical protein
MKADMQTDKHSSVLQYTVWFAIQHSYETFAVLWSAASSLSCYVCHMPHKRQQLRCDVWAPVGNKRHHQTTIR